MFGELIPCGGGPSFPLHSPKVVIGRKSSCDITIRKPTVSGVHCELEYKAGYWYVRDLDSHNGIRVDGQRCRESRLLPGDTLWVAQFRFEISYRSLDQARQEAVQRELPEELSRLDPRETLVDPPPAASCEHPQSSGNSRLLGELVPCGGGISIPLYKSPVVIGRSDGCDVRLKSPTVSGRHCRLELVRGYWQVKDLGSTNGVRVDGKRCDSQLVLPNQVLWVAKHGFTLLYDSPNQDEFYETSKEGYAFKESLLETAGLTSKSIEEERAFREEEFPQSRRWDVDTND